jgi:hypothetical protein
MPSSNEDILLDPRTGVGEGLDALPSSRLASLLSDAPPITKRLLAGGADESIDALGVIRAVTAIMAKALQDHDANLFSAGVQNMATIWSFGDPNAMYPIRTPDLEASLWERLGTALYALGGLAVRHERWKEMRELITQPGNSPTGESWLRQGQVASARSAVYADSIVTLAARRLDQLAADIDRTAALTLVCQFDLLSGLVISETDQDGYFPNCAEFSESLVEPLVIDALRGPDSALRQHVFPGNDQGLREALRAFDALARTQAALSRRHRGTWQWRGFADARTLVFIAAGQTVEEWEHDGWS